MADAWVESSLRRLQKCSSTAAIEACVIPIVLSLSEISGVKITRLGDVLRRGRVITVTEVNSIAKALGLVGWQVMRTAESAVRAAEEDVREAGAELGVPADFRNDDDSHGDRGGGVRDDEGRDNDGNGGEEGSAERNRAGKGAASSRLAGQRKGGKGTR